MFGKSGFLVNENHSNPIRELDEFPYAHRLESGNITFLDIQEDFTGLENAFAVLGAPRKPHKSNVLTILPFRNTHEKIPTPKINNFSRSKKKSEKMLIFLEKNINIFPEHFPIFLKNFRKFSKYNFLNVAKRQFF